MNTGRIMIEPLRLPLRTLNMLLKSRLFLRTKMVQVIFMLLLVAHMSVGAEDRHRHLAISPEKTAMETLQTNADYSTLVNLLQQDNLDSDLMCKYSGCPQFTLFAPSNAAFDALPPNFLDELSEEGFRDLLRYHIVKGRLYSFEFEESTTIETIQGGIIVPFNGFRVNDANIVAADIDARGGVIHFIDAVLLLPPSNEDNILSIARSNKDLSLFVQSIEEMRLQHTLTWNGPFTLFAPTNDVFQKLVESYTLTDGQYLEQLLLYHIAPAALLFGDLQSGSLQMIEGDSVSIDRHNYWFRQAMVEINGRATVVAMDTIASNGVVHIINQVLIPPPDLIA